MAYSDPTFLFEITVEELLSFEDVGNYSITAQFGDVFKMKLRDPNETLTITTGNRRTAKRSKRKGKRITIECKEQTKPTPTPKNALIASDIESLITSMLQYPLQLRLRTKQNPFLLGVAELAWSPVHIAYLQKLEENQNQPPAMVRQTITAYDEFQSKRVANLKIKLQLSRLDDSFALTTKIRSSSPKKIEFVNSLDEPGTIKTIYRNGKKPNERKNKLHGKDSKNTIESKNTDKNNDNILEVNNQTNGINNSKKHKSIADLVCSQTNITEYKKCSLTNRWSSISLDRNGRLNAMNYIFNTDGPFGNPVYCVSYFTVENDRDMTGCTGGPSPPSSKEASSNVKSNQQSGASSPTTDGKLQCASSPIDGKFNTCLNECPFEDGEGTRNICYEEVCDLEKSHNLAIIKKCDNPICDDRMALKPVMAPRNEPYRIDFNATAAQDCCKIEQIIGGVSAKLIDDPCLCTCECTFGFVKKTTYCKVCGGYELIGDEIKSTRGGDPYPCPIYHGVVKSKAPVKLSKKGSGLDSDKSLRGRGGGSVESERDMKKKKRKIDDRFKFNYGYTGIPPKIGHSQCGFSCAGGALTRVPKHMGWKWTADNVPGLKFRPGYRPGATNKHVVRLLKIAKHPEQEAAKRRRKDTGKQKRPLKRPLLIIQKKDGEYTVTMEALKPYNKPRLINQAPFEDKDPITYTVGRTEEENAIRRKRRERAQRRLEREQRAFLQSAFRDMCKDICLKTYQQALGMMPYAEDPLCPCYPENPTNDRIDLEHSCSCTESERSSESGTDDDEWIIEFTPPNAFYDPARPVKKLFYADKSIQYNYLDFRVKLLDRYGNPVPRFFIGPDGKQECSDLGGFWSADHKWLEINHDGYVAPDGRWAPNSFIGPCGEMVDAETGKFQATNGVWLSVGVDGFVDCQNQWRFYPKQRVISKDPRLQRNVEQWKREGGCKVKKTTEQNENKKGGGGGGGDNDKRPLVEKEWSCFGDTTPQTLSQMGISGHGHDRRLLLSTLEQLIKRGDKVTIPQRPSIPKAPATGKKKAKKAEGVEDRRESYGKKVRQLRRPEHIKCQHSAPSSKGIIAVDDQGNKTYFRLLDYQNQRPKQRLKALDEEGIDLSSFHVPCFSSFINSEETRKQQYEHILRHNRRVMATAVQTAISEGWRPGAISKRLLHKLNQAKLKTSTELSRTPYRKQKKLLSAEPEKPALIVAKRNGEYIIEMQNYLVNGEGKTGIGAGEHCKPLIYKVGSPDREEKIRKREKRTQKLMEKVHDDIIGKELNAADICEQRCGKAYKQAIGVIPFDPENPTLEDCICPEDMEDSENSIETYDSFEEESSDYDSLDLDWEIHFTPPNVCRKNDELHPDTQESKN